MSGSYAPRSLEEALSLLAKHPDLVPVAGCTDLMVCEQEERAGMNQVMDVLRIPEIRGICSAEGGLEIGAATSFSEIGASEAVRTTYPALAAAASVIGGWQNQNRATLGGNMANASPAGDSLPVLLVLDATVVIAAASGHREIPYDSFHVGYRKTALGPGELIATIRLPKPPPGSIQLFHKVGTRESQAISKVVVAMATGSENGRLVRVRFGAGSVADRPVRLKVAEVVCEGQAPDVALAERAADAAVASVRPIDDVRSTAGYRRFALGRVIRRLVLRAAGHMQPVSP